MPSQTIHPWHSTLYRKWAWCYDPIFKRRLSGRIQQVIQSLNMRPGARILDVGVGTGNYLAAYPKQSDVTGIDMSDSMLQYAAHRIRKQRLHQVTLRHMDALDLEFAPNTFDYVMGFHTISVVGAPRRMLSEMSRVCKPDGAIVIVNHFRTEHPWLAPWVKFISPVTRWFGWDTKLTCQELFDRSPILIEKCFKTSPWSLFTIIIGRNKKVADESPKRMGRDANGVVAPSHVCRIPNCTSYAP